ncbi:MAG TPA: hypothetical protein VKN82_02230 [Desulfohalobiaceae bacterium]|nr:hypothetical protein [Desulfohalobiaceae bacterium]
MRYVSFHTYCGLAGDLQGMLVGVDQEGYREDELYTRTGFFYYLSLCRAKRKILRRFELETGQKALES